MCVYVCKTITIKEKEAINLTSIKEEWAGDMGEVEGRKGKGEVI